MSLWNDLGDPVFDGVGLAGFKSRANMFFCWPDLLFLLVSYYFIFSSFHGLVVWGWGLLIVRVFSLSPDLALLTLFLGLAR